MSIIYYLIFIVLLIPFFIGITALLLFSMKSKTPEGLGFPQIPALLFHSVTEKSSFDQSHITTNKLNNFISYLSDNNYKTLTAFETANIKNKNIETPENCITLIFDDGFEDFFKNAFPVLQKYNLKSSVFPVVDSINGTLIQDVYTPKKCLSKKQIKTIADAGHEIGSHTMTHADLTMLSDKELYRELSESKKLLEDITGIQVRTISFPFGSWNKRIWEQSKKCGYEAAVAYRNHAQATPPILPVTGVYTFDTEEDIVEKVKQRQLLSNARTRSAVMPHFAKGTAVWKFRKTYNVFNVFRQLH